MTDTSFLHLEDSLRIAAEVSLPLARALGPETNKKYLLQLQLIKTTKLFGVYANSLFSLLQRG